MPSIDGSFVCRSDDVISMFRVFFLLFVLLCFLPAFGDWGIHPSLTFSKVISTL